MEDIRYLTVDLVVKSREDLTPIVNDFGEEVFVLHNGKTGDFYHAYLEISERYEGPNKEIGFFCSLIEALGPVERQIWDNCFSKTFDIGYECGDSNRSFSSELRPEVIERIANCGGSIEITIYPMPPENKQEQEYEPTGDIGNRIF